MTSCCFAFYLLSAQNYFCERFILMKKTDSCLITALIHAKIAYIIVLNRMSY